MMSFRRLRYLGVLVGVVGLVILHRSHLNAEPPSAATNLIADTGASRVYVKVGSATMFGHPHGVEGQLKSAKLNFSGNGEMVFDMSTFQADTAVARKRVGVDHGKIPASQPRQVTTTMQGKDVLDVTRFPSATYEVTAVMPLDHQPAGTVGDYRIEGKLTLHGKTRQVDFKAKLEAGPQQGSVKLSGTFTLKQSDYGITPYSTLGGVVKVADDLEIMGDLILVPAH